MEVHFFVAANQKVVAKVVVNGDMENPTKYRGPRFECLPFQNPKPQLSSSQAN
jgi:hypothetical protein